MPVLLLGLLLLSETAWAQTDYSLRMWSLSSHLSGIIDDPLTDAYLNPARLGRFDRMQAYGVWLPEKNVMSPFPLSTTRDLEFGPSETYDLDYEYTPLAFSVIKTIGDDKMFSAGMRASITGKDITQSHPSYDLTEWGTRHTLEQRNSGGDRGDETTHLLFDLAASGKGERAYGLRLTILHNAYRRNDLNSNSSITIDLSNMTDTSIYDYFSYNLRKYEETDIAFSMGRCASNGKWSDVSVGAAIRRLSSSVNILERRIEDSDTDRNGDRIGGGSPYLSIREQRLASHRDYLGLRLFGRAQWNVREKIRAVHTIQWNRSWGDGRAEFGADELYYGAIHDIDERSGSFAYDGIFSDLTISTATGYSEEICDGFVAVFGVKGVYTQIWFDEDGEGAAHIFLDQSNGSYDSLYYSSPYTQRHDNDAKSYSFIIPVGCEWQVHDYVKLRAGIEFNASHSTSDPKFTKAVAALDPPASFEEMGPDIYYVTSYNTQARFNSGIEINIRDKFILDLLAFSSHYTIVNFDDYGFLSVRYLF
jgi:hypothetical protein